MVYPFLPVQATSMGLTLQDLAIVAGVVPFVSTFGTIAMGEKIIDTMSCNLFSH